MIMKCPHCHAENKDDSKFCSNCAASLSPAGPDGVSLTKTLVTPPPTISKDSLVAGKYKVLDEIGRGGMGIVYKAEDIRLKRTVALKFLPPELTHIPDVKERFMREAQAAAALDHPNICTVYEFDGADWAEESLTKTAFN
jgi:serine/threonine protein kinase